MNNNKDCRVGQLTRSGPTHRPPPSRPSARATSEYHEHQNDLSCHGDDGDYSGHDDDDDDGDDDGDGDDDDNEDDIFDRPSRIVHGQAWLAETQGWDDNDNVSSNR